MDIGTRFGAFLVCALAITTSCQRERGPASSMYSASPMRSNDLANDYTKPYLSDEKIQKFLSSMKEEHNPFELIFKQGGGLRNPADLASRMAECNAFAQRYGFEDYQDYTAVWGRIMAGQIGLWGADMIKDSAKSFQKIIDDSKADLQKPNLSAEQRKLDEDQIANAQKTIDDLSKSNASSLNEADLALVKKYKDQIEAAQKKYNPGQ